MNDVVRKVTVLVAAEIGGHVLKGGSIRELPTVKYLATISASLEVAAKIADEMKAPDVAAAIRAQRPSRLTEQAWSLTFSADGNTSGS